MNNKCICVLCHDYNRVNSVIIKKLKQDILSYKNDTDLWLMFDNGEYNIHKTEYENFVKEGYNVCLFNYKDIRRKYPLNFFLLINSAFSKMNFYVGNCHFPMIEFSKQKKYDYYMFYLDDSVYTGNINLLYEKVLKNKHDAYFISEFFESTSKDRWLWISGVEVSLVPKLYFLKYNVIFHHLQNMYILSKDSIDKIIENIIQYEWLGHHLFVLPSVCKFIDLDIGLIKYHFKYCYLLWNYNSLNNIIKVLSVVDNLFDNSFFHPIKELLVYNKLYNK